MACNVHLKFFTYSTSPPLKLHVLIYFLGNLTKAQSRIDSVEIYIRSRQLVTYKTACFFMHPV